MLWLGILVTWLWVFWSEARVPMLLLVCLCCLVDSLGVCMFGCMFDGLLCLGVIGSFGYAKFGRVFACVGVCFAINVV